MARLHGRAGVLHLDGKTWASLLILGSEFGWEPRLTDSTDTRSSRKRLLQGEDWSGTYLDGEGQAVSDDDARELAKALELAIERGGEDLSEPALLSLRPRSWDRLTDEAREKLPDIISFCKAGSIRIW